MYPELVRMQQKSLNLFLSMSFCFKIFAFDEECTLIALDIFKFESTTNAMRICMCSERTGFHSTHA